jgi:hypothetical protein
MAGGRFSVTSRPGEGVMIRATFVPAEAGETPPPIPGLTTSQLHR